MTSPLATKTKRRKRNGIFKIPTVNYFILNDSHKNKQKEQLYYNCLTDHHTRGAIITVGHQKMSD